MLNVVKSSFRKMTLFLSVIYFAFATPINAQSNPNEVPSYQQHLSNSALIVSAKKIKHNLSNLDESSVLRAEALYQEAKNNKNLVSDNDFLYMSELLLTIYELNRNFDKSAKIIEQLNKYNIPSHELAALYWQATIDFAQLNFEASKKAAQALVKASINVNELGFYGKSADLLSRSFDKLGEGTKATEWSLKAANHYIKYHDNESLAGTYNNLSVFNVHRKNWQEALKYNQLAYDIVNKTANKRFSVQLLLNKSYILGELGLFDEETKTLELIIKTSKANKFTRILAYSSNNYADILMKSGRYKVALTYAQQAFDAATSMNSIHSINVAKVNLGQANVYLGEYGKGLRYLKQALASFSKSNSEYEVAEVLKIIAQAHAYMNNYEQAYSYIVQHQEKQTALFASEREERIAALQESFSSKQKEQEITTLKKEQELTTLRAEKSNHRKQILVLAVLLCFFVIVIMFTRLRSTVCSNRELKIRNSALAHEKYTDALTGLHNRRYAIDNVSNTMKRTIKPEQQFAVIMLDIDHFKRVNDSYGHNSGDMVLQEFAQRITTTLRNDDTFIRWGGEEFLLILPLSPKEISIALTRIFDCINNTMFTVENDEKIAISASMGLCFFPQTKVAKLRTWEEAMSYADKALYEAKHCGRNQAMAREYIKDSNEWIFTPLCKGEPNNAK